MDFFDKLKSATLDDWNSYVDHPFVRDLGAGTLPQSSFRFYLVQDYLFLIQFARAWALAGYKSRSMDDLQRAQRGFSGILSETELHIRLCERWGMSRQDVQVAPEHSATVAYTRFVLDCGASGDLLDLMVALAPCVIGYAEIALNLTRDGVELPNDHPYREWIGEYASQDYQALAMDSRGHLDDLAKRYLTPARFEQLVSIFAAASRLEADFWQMGLDANSP
jgi:thiaminase/transcriptional activator TenA